MSIRRSVGATALVRGAGAILLALALHPADGFGQWGDVHIEVGGSRAFAPSGTDLAAATYLTASLQVDRWTRSGSGFFAGIFGGKATSSIGGDWGSFVLGGEAARPVRVDRWSSACRHPYRGLRSVGGLSMKLYRWLRVPR